MTPGAGSSDPAGTSAGGAGWRFEDRDVRVGPLRLHLADARRDPASDTGPGGAGQGGAGQGGAGQSGAGQGGVGPGRSGPGRTVLMLHGLGAHGDAWRPVVTALGAVDRALCPDHRGHGRSDWSRDGYWLRDYAADARGLLDELGVERVDVVGHSLGARVAMVLAPLLGERLASLVLLDTGPEVSRAAALQARAQGSAKQAAGFASEEKLLAALLAEHPDFAEEQLRIRARSLYRRNWAGLLVPRGDPEVYWLLGRAGLSEVDAMWAGLRAVTAPALVLRATKSFLLDPEQGRQMARSLPNGHYEELDLGHFMHYEDPGWIARTLDRFLAGAGAGAGSGSGA
ncbi:putative hydrolase or acyltransferase of alpha/beta superfamily [Frankia sp. EI5c]|uniref:alpha/beta fold hydrolase n=1 Tax=Frankia sp. EI5c TaxID=683316 RepID=UPI0007C2E81D|nr:alpha/beta hydrolase [Frankia sp. EI5c]OAA27437.1 putative hydrolase or acyltransferase of alpha/beta superfamily [Frankia sp. EI5c]